MPSRKLTLPYFPQAPAMYEKRYLDSVVQNFSLYLQQSNNPGDGAFSTLNLSEIPSSSADQPVHEVYKDSAGRLYVTGEGYDPSTLNLTTLNATSINGDLTGDVTGNVTGNVTLGPWTVTSSGTNLSFSINGTEKMRIDENGNLSVVGNLTANAVF